MTRFQDRHIGLNAQSTVTMLSTLGYASSEELVNRAVPDSIKTVDGTKSVLPPAATETEAIAELAAFAARNTVTTSLIGLGYSNTLMPEVVKRNVLENPSWYTAYTPYQPEVSQGRLEALLNFQTMVTDLTGLDIANSSMLDEGTSVVEAMLLSRRATRGGADRYLYDSGLLPQTIALLQHRASVVGIELVAVDPLQVSAEDVAGSFGIVLQYPDASGTINDIRSTVQVAKEAGLVVTVATDLLALTLLESPGELGADIAVGNSQRFGVPMGFGGPHAGFMAVKKGLERQLPGRLVGVSVDSQGKVSYRLTLQTREQHIRREKATSNICTAQVLLAVLASMYAVYHGPAGLKQIAVRVHQQAQSFAATARDAGLNLISNQFFDTVGIRLENPTEAYDALRKLGHTPLLVSSQNQADPATVEPTISETSSINGSTPNNGSGGVLQFSFDEVSSQNSGLVLELLQTITGDLNLKLSDDTAALPSDSATGFGIPAALLRSTEFLTGRVFNNHHSETRMLRYLKYLADLDYALDRGMIPLGSCTMKLNATAEMVAISWPEFANLHPFAPEEDVVGYLDLIEQLQDWLADLTGYDTVSVQPNAGSQGELAGLLAIRGYLDSIGDQDRTVCLIPSSAHGTNAASAVLAGMKVVVVASDEAGNVDLADLKDKIAANSATLAALMITYPSTHGVYEEDVVEICDLVHAAGGQVYIDGANMNALVGYAKFGGFGGDVSHLNLHKTFAIPHGGGGPGVGPVAAKNHLAPFLPGHDRAQRVFHEGAPVSAAPYGSASILPITWAYLRMMGITGLRQATEAAVVSANYIAQRLQDLYPILYTGVDNLVAHECILDLRPLTAETGVTAEDVAKRLIDFGFHAPTMSFPVSGTLMVEPTESEDFEELERFIQAMRAIHAEILEIGSGTVALAESALRNAPHPADVLLATEWDRPYSRTDAAYPFDAAWAKLSETDLGYLDAEERTARIRGKYWAPVSRIDNAFGDRNLMCSCPPPEAFL